MKELNIKKICGVILACYVILVVGFFLIAGEQLHYRDNETDMVVNSAPIGEITADIELRQRFTAGGDEIKGVSLLLSTYGRVNTGHLTVRIQDEVGEVLTEEQIETEGLTDNSLFSLNFTVPAKTERGQTLYLVLTSPDAVSGNAVTAWWGDAISASRIQIKQAFQLEECITVNGSPLEGKLCFQLTERTELMTGKIYWYIVILLGLLLSAYASYLVRAVQNGKSPMIARVIVAFQKYEFLMRQLVARDFKTKYKRSVLGVLWSFLNPLLTMLVQYIVFSTLFQSDIPNFPLYLLTGIICFNFFSEATTMALQSIVGNASLITKVYVPKYIYPVTRVLSSGINLLLSLLPLFVVILLTKTPIRPAVLLLPFSIICLIVLCIGIGFILSALMVFFRDTQFLWGVLNMLWMYLTPIFYPESIIPEQFVQLYKCNPLYHIIRFFRIILINGVSPEPKAYLLCLLSSFIPLMLGAVIFKRQQDKFILNL